MFELEIDERLVALQNEFYPEGTLRRQKLIPHALVVARTVEKIIACNPKLQIDKQLAINGAYIHDVGIVYTHAPKLGCNGEFPYIRHGILGGHVLRQHNLSEYATFCERHVGMGLSPQFAAEKQFPQPYVEMMPQTIEEIVVCYADKFFSKSAEDMEKPEPLEMIRKEIGNYGGTALTTFDKWCDKFGVEYIYM